MTIDVGTGDGRAVLATAALDPGTLALGLDASAPAMAEASRRAACAPNKGGLPNARFVLAAAEAPPIELTGRSELVTVRFPWGSLLRGCVGADPTVAAGVASLVAPVGTLELLLAPSAGDGLDGIPTERDDLVAAVERTFTAHGLVRTTARLATASEIATSGSTWARRLRTGRSNGAGADRAVTFVRLVRPADR